MSRRIIRYSRKYQGDVAEMTKRKATTISLFDLMTKYPTEQHADAGGNIGEPCLRVDVVELGSDGGCNGVKGGEGMGGWIRQRGPVRDFERYYRGLREKSTEDGNGLGDVNIGIA